MKKGQVAVVVDTNYLALEAACAQAGLDRSLDRLVAVCERLEKEHLAFGRRLLGRNPKRQHPIALTARYFAVRCVINEAHLDEKDAISTLAYLEGCREDYQLGAMLSAALLSRGISFTRTEGFAQLDYCVHFAAKE